jgi:hypothetical protein
MIDHEGKAPISEQVICTKCGFCCDGTLFLHACLMPGERGSLPEKIEKNSFPEDGKDFFKLPCLYFNRKCTIYDRQRAFVCASYRCELLKSYAAQKISVAECIQIVKNAKQIRSEVIHNYRIFSGQKAVVVFRQLLFELGKTGSLLHTEKETNMENEMLIAKANIFQSLLIKYFISPADFDNLVIHLPEEKK